MQITSRNTNTLTDQIKNVFLSNNSESFLIKSPPNCGDEIIIHNILKKIKNIKLENNKILPIVIKIDFNNIKQYVDHIYKEINNKINLNIDINNYKDEDETILFREIVDELYDNKYHLVLIHKEFHKLWRLGNLSFIGGLRDCEMEHLITVINFCYTNYENLKKIYPDNQLVTSDYGIYHTKIDNIPLTKNEIIQECKNLNIKDELINEHINLIPKIDFLAAKYIDILHNQIDNTGVSKLLLKQMSMGFILFMQKIDNDEILKKNISFRRDVKLQYKDYSSFPFIDFLFDREEDYYVIKNNTINEFLILYSKSQDNFEKMLNEDEGERLERKSSYQFNIKERKKDTNLIEGIFKTISAMMNTEGGTILIGITDLNMIIGVNLQEEGFNNRDNMELNINDKFNDYIGLRYNNLKKIYWHEKNNKNILEIKIQRSNEPIFFISKENNKLFTRQSNRTIEIKNSDDIIHYTTDKFPDYINSLLN